MATEGEEYTSIYPGQKLSWEEFLAEEKKFVFKHGPEWDALMAKKPGLWRYDLPNALTLESLEELERVFKYADEDDEVALRLQQESKNLFIVGVAEGKWSPEEMQVLARKLASMSGIHSCYNCGKEIARGGHDMCTSCEYENKTECYGCASVGQRPHTCEQWW